MKLPLTLTQANKLSTRCQFLKGKPYDGSFGSTTPVLDISEEVANYNDFGLTGFALDPQFESNGLIYLSPNKIKRLAVTATRSEPLVVVAYLIIRPIVAAFVWLVVGL